MKSTTERQRERRAQLDKIAQAAGYPTWGKYETAVIAKGDVKMESTGNATQMSRLEAVKMVGAEIVNKLDDVQCQYYSGFSRIGSQEWTSSKRLEDDRVLTAHYFMDNEKFDGVEDLGDLDWEIEYYSIQ